jgi:NitT/TauT family transport system substrate-binding protein
MRDTQFMTKTLRLVAGMGVALTIATYQPGMAEAKEDVNIAGLTWPGYGFWYIAQEKGFVPNLDLHYQAIEDPYQSFSLASAGQIDIVSSTIEFAPIAAAQGMPIKLVAYGNLSHGTDKIIVAPDVDEPTDLKGEKVAVLEGGLSQLFMGIWLEENGVGIGEVEFVNLIMDDAVAAMVGGGVAAAEFWEPFGSQALDAMDGARVVASTAQKKWAKTALVADAHFMNADFIENRRDVALEAMRGLYRAIAWWRNNPTEGNRIIAEGMQMGVEDVELVIGADGTGEDGGLYPYDFAQTARFCGVAPGDPPFGQTNGQIEDHWRMTNKWWIKFGQMEKEIDPDQGIDCSLLGDLQADGFNPGS